jgi:hypothetical protein
MDLSTFLKKNFTHGYTNLTQLTADEWAGMTFTLLVILQSKEGKDILHHGLLPAMERVVTKEGRPVVDCTLVSHVDQSHTNSLLAVGTYDDELSNGDLIEDDEIASDNNDDGSVNITFFSLWELTEILERLLAFHAFYKRGAPYDWKDPATQESRIRLMGRQMMDMIVRGCPRTDGYGWKIQKLHELLHMASDIAMFGCPQNYDAGPGESSLKTWAKFPARTALKQGAVVFSESVAHRFHETACFS